MRLPRADVLSVLAIEGETLSNWAGKVSVGATYRSGNTDQVDYNALLRLNRETARTPWTDQYVGAVSSVSGSETANNHRLDSKFDVFLTRLLNGWEGLSLGRPEKNRQSGRGSSRVGGVSRTPEAALTSSPPSRPLTTWNQTER